MKFNLARHISNGILRKYLPIMVILIAFIPIEFYLFYSHSFPLIVNETDGIGYMARAAGPLFQAHPFHAPGYSWAIKAVQNSGLDPFSSAKVVSCTFAIIFVFVTWLILSSFSPPKEAFLATVIAAFNATTLTRSVSIMSDMMALSLALSSLALLLVPKETNKWHYIFSGILAGLAYLTRYTYIFLFTGPMIFWLLSKPRQGSRLEYFTLVTAFALGFFLVTMPWFIFLYQTKGNPFWNEHYRNVAFKIYYKDTVGQDALPLTAQYGGWLDVISPNPSLFIKSWLTTVVDLPLELLDLTPPIGVMASVGFFFWLAKLDWRKKVFLSINILYSFIVCLAWLNPRFLLLFIPLVASCIASGLFAIPRFIVPSSSATLIDKFIQRISLKPIAISLLIFSLGFHSIKQIPDHFSEEPLEYKIVAEWLAPLASTETLVMAAMPHIAFFGKSPRHIWFSSRLRNTTKLEDLPDILTSVEPTYFIYDQRYAARHFPQFHRLLDPSRNPYPELLQEVFEVDSPKKIVVYKLLMQQEE